MLRQFHNVNKITSVTSVGEKLNTMLVPDTASSSASSSIETSITIP